MQRPKELVNTMGEACASVGARRCSNTDEPQIPPDTPAINTEPLLILRQLSEEEKQQRARILSSLRDRSISSPLEAYFKRLEKGSLEWTIDNFIEGMETFARVCGSERKIHFSNEIQGLHYPNRFIQLWNREYRHLPITLYDQDFRFQCPPSWSYDFREPPSTWLLTFNGEIPLSQGLNELIRGPTTIDCGKFRRLLFWMAVRYLVGDEVFDSLFKFAKGQFTLTGNCYDPITPDMDGNWLFPFFDKPSWRADPTIPRRRIRVRTIFNHSTYLSKHPGGEVRLHNGTEIDGCYIIFDPEKPRDKLSAAELDQRMLEAYNLPRNFADAETLFIWGILPELVHPDHAPKSFAALTRDAEKFEKYIMSDTEWKGSLAAREKTDLLNSISNSTSKDCEVRLKKQQRRM